MLNTGDCSLYLDGQFAISGQWWLQSALDHCVGRNGTQISAGYISIYQPFASIIIYVYTFVNEDYFCLGAVLFIFKKGYYVTLMHFNTYIISV